MVSILFEMANQLGSFILRMVVIYTTIVIILYFIQDFLLYAPDKYHVEDLLRDVSDARHTLWPEKSGAYRGLIAAPPEIAATGTIIVFHGNAGSALDRTYYSEIFRPMGYQVVLMEYPGYGARQGDCSEKKLVDDAELSFQLLKTGFQTPVIIVGESLGAGIASALSAKHASEINGIILITPWDSLPRLAQRKFFFLPARWMVRDRYDNIANLRYYKGSIAMILAGKDEIVPNQLSMNLYDSLTCRKKRWVIEGAGHNNWPIKSGIRWWQEVLDFILMNQRKPME